MYKKGVALELQFPANRLIHAEDGAPGAAGHSDAASAPAYTVSLNADEARALLDGLRRRLAAEDITAPVVVSLANQETMPQEEQPDLDAIVLAASGATAGAVAATLDSAAVPVEYKQWVCVICGWIYDEALGLPEEGIAPGTRFEDIPDDWRCPLCDVGKEDFAVVEF